MKLSRLFLVAISLSAVGFFSPVTFASIGSKNHIKIKTIGAVDSETLSSTPFKSFSTVAPTAYRGSLTVTANQSNTDAIYVLCVSKGATAPTQAQMIAYGFKLVPGAIFVGSTSSTNIQCDVYGVSNSGSQLAQFIEKSPGNAGPDSVINPSNALGTSVSITAANVPSSGIPYGATTETFTTGATDITDTSSYAVFVAHGAGTHNYITSITGTNSSTTDTVVYIEDGSTIIAAINCKGGGGFVFNPAPYFTQATANAGINVVARTSGAALQITAIGYWK